MAGREDDRGGLPGISLADSHLAADSETRPWRFRLGLFLRALAFVELLKGLAYWGALIAAGGTPDPFGGAPAAWFAGCAFFAVVDPVAAVGLWLGAGWGVVIWLIATIGQLVLVSMEPAASASRWFVTATLMGLMALYLFLSMKARGEDVVS